MANPYNQTSAPGGGLEESASRMATEAPSTKPGAWMLDSLRVEPTANGGFVVNCSKRRKVPPRSGNGKSNGIAMGGDYDQTHDSKQYAFSTAAEALAYITKELSGTPAEDAGDTTGDDVTAVDEDA